MDDSPQRTIHGLTVNISPVERIGRVVIGLGAAIVGLLLLTATSSILGAVLEVALIVAGLDLVVTGALGHCPLYARIGHVPTHTRSS